MSNKKIYRTTIHIGYDANGNRITKTIRASSKYDLNKKKREILNARDQGKDILSKSTFDFWAQKWLVETKLNSGIKNSTIVQYKSAIKHLSSRFGSTEMKDITLSEFQQFINALSSNNPNTGKPTSKRTLESIKKSASAIFDYACNNNIDGVKNFMSSVQIPKNAPISKRRALTEEEIQWIIDTPHRAQPAAMTMLFTGLRRGELFALRWQDIDFDHRTISVQQSVEIISNQSVIKEGGKSDNAVRTIPMPPILYNYLLNYKNSVSNDSQYVCTNKSGKIFTKSSFDAMWRSYLNDLNIIYKYNSQVSKFNGKNGPLPMKIERFTPHYLRHTYATLLYLQGTNVAYAMQLLGHSDITATINIYTDLKNYNKATLSDSFKNNLKNEFSIKTE